ncbi:hypothetical protein KGF86_02100 [Ornithinibacillus massiliensis]|uniref:Uncharacterized protein n=1 Tax=Ornithinibacillus massiliensis TaxID=1944633 RepID=A0ABS5M9L6_9BACI|nr:hypothetical protein [Ornithinibacillus massiliensis]MBS3678994.1 hypothetical protein [Ornithinibacillus massiliensis]
MTEGGYRRPFLAEGEGKGKQREGVSALFWQKKLEKVTDGDYRCPFPAERE